VLYHLLAGRPPFYGRNVALVLDALRTRRPRDPRWLREDLPRDVVRVLDRCLRKAPDQRYPTAAALCADLEALLAGRAPAGGAPPGSAWERPIDGKS
jgi:serine/threonine-protein kinase